jgi:hypothetical protein
MVENNKKKFETSETINFISKITTGVTHEINNVFASIKELNGLMEDLISFSEETNFRYHDKCITTLSKVKDQINRGVDVTSRLNKFSHLTDKQFVNFNLIEVIEQLVFLSQRFGRTKNIQIKFEKNNNVISVYTTALIIQYVIFKCIIELIEFLPNESQISIFCNSYGDKCEVTFTNKNNNEIARLDSIIIKKLKEHIKPLRSYNLNLEVEEENLKLVLSFHDFKLD